MENGGIDLITRCMRLCLRFVSCIQIPFLVPSADPSLTHSHSYDKIRAEKGTA
ncbi:hypothetical protein HMPREF1992_00848 [Selenomonas sp. oral taxon 892 str. F0426]|nr:hypothetical protein HMPREF1992_00848 [Selenomonas sp. oral taxon 892 str. F0426]